MGHALGVRIVEQDARRRLTNGDRRRAAAWRRRRAGRQPVPHHPAAGREIEQAVAGFHVGVELVFLEMLQQGAAGAVHDAFGTLVVPDEYMMKSG